eukprot:443014-Pyramimonas_sp.AAC.1
MGCLGILLRESWALLGGLLNRVRCPVRGSWAIAGPSWTRSWVFQETLWGRARARATRPGKRPLLAEPS